jgi:hypothetical protein
MSASSDFISWKMQYQITPIILTGGLAAQQGGAIPIIQLTDPGISGITANDTGVDVTGQITGANLNAQLDGAFANYQPLPGSSLIDLQAAQYPFANQAVAANAVIKNPLTVPMLMTCPATDEVTYAAKQAVITALQSSLQQHITLGGLFTVVTPAFIYTNCILLRMIDVGSETHQAQVQYRWDFYQPLVSLQAAQQAQSTLIQAITNGTPMSGLPSWAGGTSVANPGNTLSSSLNDNPYLQ